MKKRSLADILGGRSFMDNGNTPGTASWRVKTSTRIKQQDKTKKRFGQ